VNIYSRRIGLGGHDHAALYDAFVGTHMGKPLSVIANTIKGAGVSSINDGGKWRNNAPSTEEIGIALKDPAQ
jgi:transketolase